MKVLITGATGLIGSAVTKKFQQEGISVNYLTTSTEKIEDKENYHGFAWNPRKDEINTACFKDVDTIIHLAGASIAERWTEKHKQAIISSRVDSAKLLFNSLKESDNKVRHFISASAVGAYPSSLTEIYDENYPEYNSGFLGEVVEKWEQAADRFAELNIAVTKIRIGVVLSESGGALEQLLKPIKNYVGAPLGSGDQWQSWIHLEDLAGIFYHCKKNQLSGIYNAAAPNPVTNETLTRESATLLNKPLWLPNVPSFMLRLILGEMAAIVLESQKVSSDKIREAGYVFRFDQLHKALKDLL